MARPKVNPPTTHVRVEKSIVIDFNKEMPGIRHSDVVRMAWQMYKGVQKAGTLIYGKKIWKKPKKK